MKYLFTLILITLIGFSGVAQEVEEKQRTLITKRTASWCGNCGTWGWAFMEGLIEDNEEKAVLIAAHYSGDLQTQFAIDMTNNFGGSGQPNFFVGNDRLPAGSSSWPSFRTDTKTFVDMNFEADPIANTGLKATFLDNSQLLIETKTKFFADTNGDYYLSIFVLDNNLINNQSGQGANAQHKKVLIASATGDAFGESVASGSVSNGTEMTKEYTIAGLDSSKNLDYEVVAIIWDFQNGIRNFVNAFSLDGSQFSVPVSVEQSIDPGTYAVFPSMSSDLINIRLNQADAQNAAVKIFDLNGQMVKTIYNGSYQAALNLEVSKSALGISNGTYLIHINVDGKIATEKVIFMD